MHLENNTTRQWNLTFVINDIIQEQIVHSTPTSTRKKNKKNCFVFLHRHRTHRQSGWVSPVHHDWVQFRSNFAHLSQFCHHRLRLILLFVCVVIANCSIRLFFVLLFSLIAVECTKQKCGFAICCFYVVMYTWDIHVFHRYDQCWTTSHKHTQSEVLPQNCTQFYLCVKSSEGVWCLRRLAVRSFARVCPTIAEGNRCHPAKTTAYKDLELTHIHHPYNVRCFCWCCCCERGKNPASCVHLSLTLHDSVLKQIATASSKASNNNAKWRASSVLYCRNGFL